ncbi:MAG: ubiquitin-activating E1 FCCH domain-containing protein [Pseudomonadota bacterium]|nr:ubiquitin-activating E1 FCCH domain-containing protein [Pseudomonadota bacterium]
MARSAPSFASFTAGELSPRLEGRTNLEKYREGLAELTNMVVMPHGGVTRRPGTEFLGEVKDSSVKTRLIPFQFKTSDTYILEFGNQVMRVYRDGLVVLNATDQTITNATAANPVVITANSHGFSNGDEIYIDNVGGMTQLNGRQFRVANKTTNTFRLKNLFNEDIDGSAFSAYTSGGTATLIYEEPTPYAAADIFNLRFAQSADVMYIVHPSYPIRTLTRSGHNNWTFATLTITGSPSPNINNATNQYPSVVTFFEQRLIFANTNNNPQTLWMSKNGDYTNFTTGSADDDALVYTIAANQVNAIRYLSATRVLTVGTSGGEYVVTASNDGPITPTTTLIRKYSNYGSALIEPVQVADVTLFVQRGKRKIREFKYVGEVNTAAYQAPEMTILAEHITKGGLTQFAYQQEPDSVVWATRQDGTLLGMTYRREEDVVAWHKHIIGGSFSGGQAVVESIATLPSDTGEDRLFMIVKRTINGQTKRYIEQMKPFDFGGVTTNAHFVDSGLSYAGSAVNSLTGLHHLSGQTLEVLVNGASHPQSTVTNGGINLSFSATTAAVGYGFTSAMKTLRVESGSSDGTSQGKPKRIHAISLRLFETVGIEVGNSPDNIDRIPFRDSSMPMDQAIPLFTGDKEIEFRGGYGEDRIYVQQNQALPMTVLSFYPRMNTFDI